MTEPAERSRPYVPGYGIPEDRRGILSWAFVEERMSAARDYWIATVRPDGSPHLTPVWGVWVDRTFYFGSGPQTRKVRNLAENLRVAVHPDGDDVVILEGAAERIIDPDRALAERIRDASVAKYGLGSHDIEGYFAVRPQVVLAWTKNGFPNTATRWAFD